MSSSYTPIETTYHTSATVADDGDAAAVTILSATDETALDNAAWCRGQLRKSRIMTFGSQSYVESAAGTFLRDFNFIDLYTTASGETLRVQIPNLVHGDSLDGVTVLFVPKTTHVGLPGTNITIRVSRVALAYNVTPAVPTVLGTATYTPVDLADYTNGKVKSVSITGLGHTVNATGYAYFIDVDDEDGANAIAGNAFVAFTTNYT